MRWIESFLDLGDRLNETFLLLHLLLVLLDRWLQVREVAVLLGHSYQ